MFADEQIDKLELRFYGYLNLSRLRRGYPIEKNILLTDTLLIEIADEPTRKLLGFSYAVRPYFSMMDKKIIEGMVILPIGDGALLKITESFRKGKQIYL